MTTVDDFRPVLRPRRPNAAAVGRETIATLADGSMTRFAAMTVAFWSLFWTLNGLDKFFNQPTFFGVNREAAFIDTFANLGLPAPVAVATLYGVGVYEIVLGVAFAVALVSGARLRGLTSLCLEASLLLFVTFAAGDILFGARQELWEHTCYMGLIILSMMLLRQTRRPAGN